MLAGRRRRYFGFPRNLDGYIHTPESAKSYASRLSSAQSFTAALKACNNADVFPDPAVSRHYADQHLHSTIATQIPQLLPPMKNTMRFKDFQGNSMKFHPPSLERHFERSLYYIWLSKNDRHELCRIVDSHLGGRGKGTKSHRASGEYREIGNPIQRPTPAIYASMPRTLSILDDEITDIKSLKSKFQKGIWDTPKTPRDRFVRDHGKSPAMEAICTTYPGNAMTRVTENDINDCFLAAKRLLGPYTGLNTAVDYSQEEIPDDIVEHIRVKDEIERLETEKKKEDGISKRLFGYNSSQIKYERQIAAAVEYYNKLKRGYRNPLPPQAIIETMIDNEKKVYLFKNASLNRLLMQERKLRSTAREKEEVKERKKSLHQKSTKEKSKRKFDKTNVTDEDVMDMYIHYLSPDQDTTLVKHIRSFTDLAKLRKQMNLGDDPTATDVEITKLLAEDDLAEIKNPFERRLLQGKINPLSKDCRITVGDITKVRDIVKTHIARITDPTLQKLYNKFGVMPLEASSSTGSLSTVDSLATTEYDSANDEEDDRIEQELLHLIRGSMTNVLKELRSGMGTNGQEDDDDWMEGEFGLEVSSDSESSNKSVVKADELQPLEVCNQYDFDCMSAHGFLGPHPFGRSNAQGSQSGSLNSEDGIKANASTSPVPNATNAMDRFNIDHFKDNN